MTGTKGKTLAELDVNPGDVVEVYGGPRFTVTKIDGDNVFGVCGSIFPLSRELPFRIVSTAVRANPTRAQIDLKIAELTAQRDSMPEMVLAYWSMGTGFTNLCYGQSTHYREFPVDHGGVPEWFTDVSK